MASGTTLQQQLMAARAIQWRDSDRITRHPVLPPVSPARRPWATSPFRVGLREKEREAAKSGSIERTVTRSTYFDTDAGVGRAKSDVCARTCSCGSVSWPVAAPRQVAPSKVPHRRPRTPKQSKLGLLEESLIHDPWQLLIGCVLLNRTQRCQVDKVLPRLLRRWPDAEALASAPVEELTPMLKHVGMHNRRGVGLVRLARKWLAMEWSCPCQLPLVGKYAADAWHLWISGRWKAVEPGDDALTMFRAWKGDLSAQAGRSGMRAGTSAQ
jgi:methyl-CpG-binding domain protein 4